MRFAWMFAGCTALGLVASMAATRPVAAQSERGTLRGTVVSEEEGLPIPGALVALDAGLRTTADEEGRFVLVDVVEGPYRIAAVAPGCHVGLGDVNVVGSREAEVRVTVELPRDVEERLRAWTLSTRSLGSTVKTITGEDLRRRNAQTVQDAVRLVAPGMIGEESGQAGGRQRVLGRSAPTVSGAREPLIVVDGVRMMQRPWDALAALNPVDIERIEVARGATGGWQYGLSGANGVIRITTRNARTGFDRETPPEQCRFTFSD